MLVADVRTIESGKYEISSHGNRYVSKSVLRNRIEREARIVCKNKPYILSGSNGVLRKVPNAPAGTTKTFINTVVCE